ncbi:pseudouridine synthase [Paraburkholderia sp. T12-10]|nr:pseudouridine synthase [Paraburkholderia sp. T12-10]
MRVKLTAKHPRPASPSRTPVRPSSPSARKPPRTRDAAPSTPPGKSATARTGGDAAPRKPRDDAPRKPREDAAAKAPRARPTERRADDVRRRFAGEGEARATRAPRSESGGERGPRGAKRTDATAARGTEDKPRRTPRAADASDARGPRGPRPSRDESERGARASTRAGGGDRQRGSAPERKRSVQSERFARDDRPARSAAEPRSRATGTDAASTRKIARPVKQGVGTTGPTTPRRDGAGAGRSSAGAKAGGRERPASSEARGRPPAGRRVDAATANARPTPTRAGAKSTQAAPHGANRAKPGAEDAEGLVRLSKRMSELGLCSRREADEWIENGWVRVDGERIDTLGTRIRPDQQIEVTRDAHAAQSRQVTILLHKPIGYVSGQAEDGYEPAITLITAANRWEGDRATTRFLPSHLRALAPAGRLDIDSTGLLVLTQDGRIAKQLIGEHSSVEKEYLVRVTYGDRTTDIDQHFPADQLARLRFGLSLDDVPLKPAKVSWQNSEQLRFVLREGKKRQIRRMCELVGLHVVGLKRVRMGRVTLGALPQGQWRYLLPDEAF